MAMLALTLPLALLTPQQDLFGPSVVLTPGLPRTHRFAVADLDRDGRPDAVAGTGAGLVFVADLSGPVGTAQVPVDGTAGTARAVAIGDVDGDGLDDVVALFGQDSQREVRWYTSADRAVSFTLAGADALTVPLLDLVVHDVDQDGDGDLVGARRPAFDMDLWWVQNQGGTFSGPALQLHPGPVHDVPLPRTGRAGYGFADVDGDGASDLVLDSTTQQRVRVLPGLAGGGFGSQVTVPGPFGAPRRTVLADMDGDGDLDALAFAGSQVLVRPQVAPFAFSGPVPVGPAVSFTILQGMAPADLDGDGTDDLVVARSTSGGAPPFSLAWFPGLGGGAFGAPASMAAGISEVLDSVRDDVDGDGLPDSVYTEEGWKVRSGTLSLGVPELAAEVRLDTPGPLLMAAAGGDFDGDGDRDVVAAERGALGHLLRFEALGAGVLDAPLTAAVQAGVGNFGSWLGLGAGDLDGDGRDELLAWSESGRVHGWLLEEVSGTFHELPVQPTPTAGIARNSLRPPRFEDVDGDGDLDVLGWSFASALATTPSSLVVQWNGGSGGGWTSTELAGATAAAAADLDGDGVRDLVAARTLAVGGATVSWYRGLGPATLAPVQDLVQGVGTRFLGVADMTGDGLADVVVSGDPASSGGAVELLLLERIPGAAPAFAPARVLLDLTGAPTDFAPILTDLDHDGRVDVVCRVDGAFVPTGDGLQLWRGDGAGGLIGPALLSPRSFGALFELGDLDDDGDADLLQWAPVNTNEGSALVLRAGTLRPAAGTPVCGPANDNSSGGPARMLAFGHVTPTSTDLELRTIGLPVHVLGIYAASRTLGPPFPLAGSSGSLCLRGSIGRFDGPTQILDSGPGGVFRLALDPGAIEQPNGPVPVLAGETWAFQAWFRDVVGGAATSNLSDALVLEF